MSRRNKWKLKIDKKSFTESEENLLESEMDSVHSVPQNITKEEFGGAKRKNYNELWRWDTLEDVEFK
jgi:hypothetical protein